MVSDRTMHLIDQLFSLLILSLVVASIAWTVTQEEIFRELQDYCVRRSKEGRTLLERKFFYLFTCEYCFSHWVALVVVLSTGFTLLIDDWRGNIIGFFVLTWVANQWMSLYRRLRVEIKYENAKAENEKEAADNGSDKDVSE
jgi:hypothetical protein